ncbi:Elongator complex protein 6 [Wickerhamomyces ciferrii]|uniref:Elongator complex protein 6 n=1 Tax=Wickerhamomyces ciferrii (strain ATCC 14091 / BCRC 22168 / CBS 111 / JCM 3599 / NBRC 0793 / NRRL Y-1031 F-60-10) TaxID=1206466 RepID=K0KYJ4_WICCF|nr:Elongator complex protein 6 [Wickerhamomyces ciferrii]CCH46153.1 Elongator complex protein 6 [Wickerhamomyces ciferrii]
MSQQQDLNLFVDNSIIPQKVYRDEPLFGVITHTQGTSPSWLINLLIENALYGTCVINHEKNQHRQLRSNVVVISFLNDFDFYEKDLKRNGIEVNDNQQFHFIDLFTDLFQKINTPESIVKIFDQLSKTIQNIPNKKTILIEGIEFLLSSTGITSIQLLNQINKLNKIADALFIITGADKELIDIQHANPSLPEFKTLDFIIRLLHRSNIVLGLRPLETGRAKDITGTLTISKGTIPFDSLVVSEKEYLFFVSRETTKLFFR